MKEFFAPPAWAGAAFLIGLVIVGSLADIPSSANQNVEENKHASGPSGPIPEPSPQKISLRDELIREQAKSGLGLVSVEGATVFSVSFSTGRYAQVAEVAHGINGSVGAITQDGTHVAVRTLPPQEFPAYKTPIMVLGVQVLDGHPVREYQQVVNPDEFCWSPDNESLAVGSWRRTSGSRFEDASLGVLQIGPGTIVEVGIHGFITAECWSPDGRQIVYSDFGNLFAKDTPEERNSKVRIVSLTDHKAHEIANGKAPTWSPDGNWIAFYDEDGYYAIRPSGADRRLLFKMSRPTSCVTWSPDSQLLAYRGELARPSHFLSVDEVYWLTVRRLADGAETRVARMDAYQSFQWVTSPELVRR